MTTHAPCRTGRLAPITFLAATIAAAITLGFPSGAAAQGAVPHGRVESPLPKERGSSALWAGRQALVRLHQLNQAEIAVARVALKRAGRSEVQAFARQVLDEHQRSERHVQQLARRIGVELSLDGRDLALRASAQAAQRRVERFSRLSAPSLDLEYLGAAPILRDEALAFVREARAVVVDPALRDELIRSENLLVAQRDVARRALDRLALDPAFRGWTGRR